MTTRMTPENIRHIRGHYPETVSLTSGWQVYDTEGNVQRGVLPIQESRVRELNGDRRWGVVVETMQATRQIRVMVLPAQDVVPNAPQHWEANIAGHRSRNLGVEAAPENNTTRAADGFLGSAAAPPPFPTDPVASAFAGEVQPTEAQSRGILLEDIRNTVQQAVRRELGSAEQRIANDRTEHQETRQTLRTLRTAVQNLANPGDTSEAVLAEVSRRAREEIVNFLPTLEEFSQVLQNHLHSMLSRASRADVGPVTPEFEAFLRYVHENELPNTFRRLIEHYPLTDAAREEFLNAQSENYSASSGNDLRGRFDGAGSDSNDHTDTDGFRPIDIPERRTPSQDDHQHSGSTVPEYDRTGGSGRSVPIPSGGSTEPPTTGPGDADQQSGPES